MKQGAGDSPPVPLPPREGHERGDREEHALERVAERAHGEDQHGHDEANAIRASAPPFDRSLHATRFCPDFEHDSGDEYRRRPASATGKTSQPRREYTRREARAPRAPRRNRMWGVLKPAGEQRPTTTEQPPPRRSTPRSSAAPRRSRRVLRRELPRVVHFHAEHVRSGHLHGLVVLVGVDVPGREAREQSTASNAAYRALPSVSGRFGGGGGGSGSAGFVETRGLCACPRVRLLLLRRDPPAPSRRPAPTPNDPSHLPSRNRRDTSRTPPSSTIPARRRWRRRSPPTPPPWWAWRWRARERTTARMAWSRAGGVRVRGCSKGSWRPRGE